MSSLVRRVQHDKLDERGRDPFAELERIQQELASYLESWQQLPDATGRYRPLADVEELDDAYVIEIELPGVLRDDIDIEVAGSRVMVSGEQKRKERIGILRRRERTIGRFFYEVTLPGDIDDAAVTANLDEGVLTVRLAKPAHAQRRRIAVQ